ncbi:MAG: CotH kinase family protein [Blautia sp.]|nr:CotH kinase family protein [Blautia sp.]
MVTNKYITRIASVIMAAAVILCLMASLFSDKLQEVYGNNAVTMKYESKLFSTDQIMDIDILMDEDDWNNMLENAISEEYYSCNVVVNGKTFYSVGIRPKGNTSLSSIVNDPDTDRYSFKLEFDHYIEGQTCYGLDKLILNNNYADATNMKEAIVYDMYQYLGVDASLYNYAKISVNGDYRGVYLALEAVEDSFMLRNYGTEDGNLYKPESMGIGGGVDGNGFPQKGEMPDGEDFPQKGEMPDGEDFPQKGEMPDGNGFPQKGEMPDGADFPQKGEMPDGEDFPQKGEMPDGEDFPQMGEAPNGEAADIKMGIMGGNGGADLNYTDDDLDSYSTIWDGEITDSDKKDHKRVVEALKNISEGTDLETYMDVDNILKYMAVHTFVVNDDSLSGTMAHNYYLYEYNGKLNILPWDYNLSFGGMSMGGKMGGQSLGATSVINDAIDTPFSITDFFDALLENEEYLEQYHGYLNELVEKYVNGGEFEKTYERIRSQIDDLVGNDPTAFYSYEEYEEAANMLIEVVQLRAKSVSGQLAGTIPSTDEGQQQDSSNLIDGSDIDLSVMGSFSGGGGGNEGQGKDNGFAGTPQPFDAGDVSPISEEKADLQDSNQDSVK